MKTIESETTLAAAPDEVWSVITGFSAYPEWNPFITRMEAELREAAAFRAKSCLPSGLRLGFVGRILSIDPGKRISWIGRPTTMPAAAMEVTHIFTLRAVDGGTHLHQREEATGFMVPISGWILGQARKGQVEMNDALARRLAQH